MIHVYFGTKGWTWLPNHVRKCLMCLEYDGGRWGWQGSYCRVDAPFNPGVETSSPLWEPPLVHTRMIVYRYIAFCPNPDSYVSKNFTISTHCVSGIALTSTVAQGHSPAGPGYFVSVCTQSINNMSWRKANIITSLTWVAFNNSRMT